MGGFRLAPPGSRAGRRHDARGQARREEIRCLKGGRIHCCDNRTAPGHGQCGLVPMASPYRAMVPRSMRDYIRRVGVPALLPKYEQGPCFSSPLALLLALVGVEC